MDDIFWAGFQSHSDNRSWTDNPYQCGTSEHAEWENDWNYGEKCAEYESQGIRTELEPYGDPCRTDPPLPRQPKPIKLFSTDNIGPNLRLIGLLAKGLAYGAYFTGKGAWWGIKKLLKKN